MTFQSSLFYQLVIRLFFVVVCFFPLVLQADERIISFVSEVSLEESSAIVVSETITYDFGEAKRRGIIRELDTKSAQAPSVWYLDRSIDIQVLSVARNNEPAQYEITESRDTVSVRIGDPEVFLTGPQEYQITYRARGALSEFTDETAELAWNVTGTRWGVPIDYVEVNMYVSNDIRLPQFACYFGSLYSTTRCDSAATATESVVSFAVSNVEPWQGVTVAQSLKVPFSIEKIEFFSIVRVLEHVGGVFASVFASVFGVIDVVLQNVWLQLSAFVATIGIAIVRYRSVHRWQHAHTDPQAPIVAQYDPYQDLDPTTLGILYDGKLHNRDVIAGLLYVAERGFVTLSVPRSAGLSRVSPDPARVLLTIVRLPEQIASSEWKILELFFGDELVPGSVITLKVAAQRLYPGSLTRSALERAIRDRLFEQGYLELRASHEPVSVIGRRKQKTWVIPVLMVMSFFSYVPYPLYAVLALVWIGLYIAYHNVGTERFTQRGNQAKRHMLGLQRYMSVAEKERYEFHNAPEKSPETFMRLLPYAIAFGVEDSWSEYFSDIALPPPDWYSGGDINTFTPGLLTSQLHAFESSLPAPPRSSSSSGSYSSSSSSSSSSSGGGSVGSGSGGGGGSSW